MTSGLNEAALENRGLNNVSVGSFFFIGLRRVRGSGFEVRGSGFGLGYEFFREFRVRVYRARRELSSVQRTIQDFCRGLYRVF
jgi:hypothetical protein